MELNLINKSRSRLPRTFLKEWIHLVQAALEKKGFPKVLKNKDLILVFLDRKPAQKLNLQFRGRDYATDILSFDPIDPGSLGELVICPDVLKVQAKQHALSFQMELGYMVLHGVLHLLGFEHEEKEEDAFVMFKLQDEIFDAISKRYVNRRRTSRG